MVKIMDMEQEKLARNMGDGHRIIHGVAGSGKTLILAYRAMYLDKFNYNIELFALLKSTPCPVVLTFHEQVARNEKGQPTGKFRTVVSGGQFKDVLEGCVGMMVRTLNEKGKYLLQVRSNDVFDAMIAPGYKIPLDIKTIDITDTTAFQALQKYKA
jgi:hypothetical protein